MKREDVYKLIDGEREYQMSKWTPQSATRAGIHTPEEWIVYMEDYLAEAKHILAREGMPECEQKAMQIIRKVTAMGVCAMEQIDTAPRT